MSGMVETETRGGMPEHVEPPCGREVRGDLVCMLCGRTGGTVRGRRTPHLTLTSLHVPDPRHVEAVRRFRCPSCSGRLWLQDSEEVLAVRRTLAGEDLRPRPGRPRKVPAVS
jgi:hypothetical protein